ncbi:MAG: hypothetical protein JO249_07320 [Acidobacteria bacterium]|nr:hypothetical protein [Acidobacteriota bacterium]
MNDYERKQIIEALDRENSTQQRRILETLNSFKNWMMLALSILYRKLTNELTKLWSWLKRLW